MSIALSIGNNLTTNGVFTADAVNNTSVTNVTDFASVPAGGVLKLLSTQTASASASISFTSGIDSTYDSYVFKFINIHHQTDVSRFTFQVSTNGGSTYGVTCTNTMFRALHDEADSSTELSYSTGWDLAQSTNFTQISDIQMGNENDENLCGYLQIFNPSSSTFVKHYISRAIGSSQNDEAIDLYGTGYFNTTSPVNAIQFKADTGNIDDGIIKMYGVV